MHNKKHTKESIEKMSKSKTTHGMTNTRFYCIWTKMKVRCLNKNYDHFKLYGGRGIKVEWKSFEQFRDDMHDSYLEHCLEFGIKETTIDRIDNNKNYCLENCRWATIKQQANNRNSNHFITFNGQTKTLSEWAEKTGIDEKNIKNRLDKLNWSVLETLTIPVFK
jgi:hypothetical protein